MTKTLYLLRISNLYYSENGWWQMNIFNPKFFETMEEAQAMKESELPYSENAVIDKSVITL